MQLSEAGRNDATLNYAWAINVGELSGQDSFELAPGHILRRAAADERDTIRTFLSNLHRAWPFSHGIAAWEGQLPLAGPIIGLPPEEWRYFVIEFPGTNHVLARIQEACDLLQPGIEVGITVLRDVVAPGGLGLTYYPARLFHHLEQLPRDNFFVNVSGDQAKAIRTLQEKLERYPHDVVNLRRFIGQVRSLKALPHHSPLRFLGYFGILEGLLTHKPSPADTIDSITRQVKRKIALLNNRWQPRLDYTVFRVGDDKLWSKMYEYRSHLAHGSEPDFAAGDLTGLVSAERALALLIAAVQAVIRFALDEPRLLADLKDC